MCGSPNINVMFFTLFGGSPKLKVKFFTQFLLGGQMHNTGE